MSSLQVSSKRPSRGGADPHQHGQWYSPAVFTATLLDSCSQGWCFCKPTVEANCVGAPCQSSCVPVCFDQVRAVSGASRAQQQAHHYPAGFHSEKCTRHGRRSRYHSSFLLPVCSRTQYDLYTRQHNVTILFTWLFGTIVVVSSPPTCCLLP